MLFKTVDRAH